MFEELKNSIKEVSQKIKNIDKKTAVDEYLSLVKQKAELEKKLTDKKIKLIEMQKNKKDRSRREHVKFLAGGIIAKYYPNIFELKTDEDIENAVKKVLRIENQNQDYFEINADKFEIIEKDGEEYYKVKKQI
jgi:hypothetical protein